MLGLALPRCKLCPPKSDPKPWGVLMGRAAGPLPAAPLGSRVDSTGSGLPVRPPNSRRGTEIRVRASGGFLLFYQSNAMQHPPCELVSRASVLQPSDEQQKGSSAFFSGSVGCAKALSKLKTISRQGEVLDIPRPPRISQFRNYDVPDRCLPFEAPFEPAREASAALASVL